MPTPQELGLVYDPYRGWINPNAAQSASLGDPGVTASYVNASNGGQDGGGFWNPASQGDLQYLYRPTQEGRSAVGDYQDVYGKDGKYIGSGDIRPDDTLKQFLIAGSMLAGGVGATMMGLGGAGAAAGGAGGGGGSLGANGAFLGEAPWTATGAGGSAAAAGGGGAAEGALGANGAFLGEGVASGVPAWDAAATNAGLSLSGAGGLLGGAAKYIPGLLGALAGGKSGNAGGAGGAREIDPRLIPYIYGDENNKGGFGYATGLLNTPVAPNGFERFYGRK